ncbi:serine hydroxymethyltransferase [Mesomycoplasma bovoculi]|uniref:Probable serine hydroxymethyltransferase n=1 Tax=Mesomycoplasma bovoculi M165/69 TaxID=743966 RepID=W5UTD4_9BACT|nr:serine hydroxymethyltransferase [Mesomycoplasma bovoculi]AHH45479.1 serine hydroxymethyltransferase [Mesomycoplasma bovoculi M165/69]
MYKKVKLYDKQITKIINDESKRQQEQIELIASENYASQDILDATGSSLANKYGEGYPGKRYYGGCQNIDKIEQIAIERAKKLFGVEYANVQPYSGSSANAAVFAALLKPGDKILGLDLASGGHLTHGYKVNFSGMFYTGFNYGLGEDELLDYNQIEKIALEVKPSLIICGYSAYSGHIDYKRFRQIADKVGAYLLADIAHTAGLIAAKVLNSPVEFAHVMTATTQKTLRCTRGGLILANDPEIIAKINKVVFPGMQGGPLFHAIAGKAVGFGEALQPWFVDYAKQVVANAKAFANFFIKKGARVISGGTTNHLFIVDVFSSYGLTGKEAQILLESINIITNKNTIPKDTKSPMITSGIRFGTPAMTSRGFQTNEFEQIGEIIHQVLTLKKLNRTQRVSFKKQVAQLAKGFPIKKSYWK